MRNIKYTTDEYISLISHKNIVPLDQYNGMHNKILHRCLICDHEWLVRPGSIIRKHGCPYCYKRAISKPLSDVKTELDNLNWTLVDENQYLHCKKSPSLEPLLFKHTCGNIVQSNLDRILRQTKRCLFCKPAKLKPHWSNPVNVNNRQYQSVLEAECCEYLINKFGVNDVKLQKSYNLTSRQTCDAYIESVDTYIEISSIKKRWYYERIYKKRQLVNNFIFVSSLNELKLFF